MDVYSIIKWYHSIKSPRLKLLGILGLHLLHRRYLYIAMDPALACNLRCRMCYFSDPQTVKDMSGSHFFDGIEVVTAVPLHRSKLAHRGYNQSEYLARGIADALDINYIEALKAVRPHSTQTHKGAMERWQNIQGNYALNEKVANQLAGKHILLVDDVITTGSTLTVCAALLKSVPGTTVSLFTLAAARLE